MPAERTRDDASVWLSTTNCDIAFAPNVTPGTFNEFYSPTDATLAPGLEGSAARRSGHNRKKPTNHIPRPPNAFILFRSASIKSQHVSSEVETNHSTLSKIIGLTWKNLPNEERQIWHARAKLALDEHKRKFPSYAFKPVHNKPRGVPGEKRKVREVEPKDHTRCAKIAELLVGGKKGLELEVAIQEFDKNHVPEIVTRFEAPITANNYALSSMNNADNKRRSSRHSQAPPSSPSLDISRELCEDSPSFNQHSLSSPTLSSSPSFIDFDTFPSCDNGPHLSPFETPTPAVSPLQFSYNSHDLVHPRPSISIPSNFSLIDDWTQSGSSPISNPTDSLPTTPCQLNVPFPESYTAYSLEQRSDYTLDNPYANHSLYSPYSNVHAFGGDEYGNVQPGLLSCELDHHKAPGTQGDLDFSTFMASLPFETLTRINQI
jgi:hypothetical protein